MTSNLQQEACEIGVKNLNAVIQKHDTVTILRLYQSTIAALLRNKSHFKLNEHDSLLINCYYKFT